MNCRICSHSHLVEVLDMGRVPPVNTLTKPNEPSTSYPLKLLECAACGLWQLESLPPRREVFPDAYPYRSATTPELLKNFRDLRHRTHYDFQENDIIIDIGGNDGTLLNLFPKTCERFNFEPTYAGRETPEGIGWIYDYWTLSSAKEHLAGKKAKLIMATNVFAHADNLLDMAEGVSYALADDGVFVVEVQDRRDLVFDTIYHEHVAYYRPQDLVNLMRQVGLKLCWLERISTHGGSFRAFFARHRAEIFFLESSLNAATFRNETRIQINAIRQEVAKRYLRGETLWAVGAPSRGTTLLHMTGIAPFLGGVAEMKSSPKVGLQMPGTSLGVFDDESFLKAYPDAAILLSWHLESLPQRLRDKGYRGDIIIPLRTLHVDSI